MNNSETTLLTSYVTKFGGSAEELEKMMAIFDRPPVSRTIPKNRYCNKAYAANSQQQFTINTVIILANKLFHTLEATPDPSAFSTWCKEQYGFTPFVKEELRYKGYLYGRAAFFNFLQIGNCSYRCCLAAMKLRRLISDTNVSIIVQSAPSRDQYIICLGNKESGWYVYDPLTNGRIIFPFKHYQQNVLPTFEEIPNEQRGMQFNFQVTHDDANDFHARWPKIQAAMVKLAKEKLPSESELLNDSLYIKAIGRNGIKDNEHKEAVKEALKGFKLILEENEQKKT